MYEKILQVENGSIINAIQDIDRIEIKPSYFMLSKGHPCAGHLFSYDDATGKLKLKIDDGFDDLMRTYHNMQEYDITFHTNRLAFQLQHESLKWMKDHNLFEVLIKNPEYKTFRNQFRKFNRVERAYLNNEQNLAVENILALNDSIPYLLHGPPGKQNEINTLYLVPSAATYIMNIFCSQNLSTQKILYFLGTGKTRVIVAAIHEIVRTTQKYILVCAQSNAACNELSLRLLNVLRENEIMRVFAISYKKEWMDEKISKISNLRGNRCNFPSFEHLYKFRVVVCTLITAGSMTRGRSQKDFDPTHFDYTFIDEAACVQENITLIPIAGVSSELNKINTQVVLAGDHQQLDAVVKSKFATRLGYKASFMEYLSNQMCFKRGSMGEYNPNRIVQLKKNYRSHPKIIHIPNQLFYDGILEPAAESGH